MFICEICDYKTKDKSNFTRHKRTKKHLENASTRDKTTEIFNCTLEHSNALLCGNMKNITCKYCNEKFTRKSSLTRHYKTCKEKEEKQEINKLTIEHLEKLLDEREKRFEELLKEKEERLKEKDDVINNGYKVVEKMSSMLRYITKHYPNNPPIESFDINNMLEGKDDEEIIKEMIYLYTNKSMHIHLGDVILDEYCKDNKKEQSVFVSDVPRLTFIIRELFENGKVGWIRDKSGTTINKKIIKIIISKLISICEDELKDIIGIQGRGIIIQKKKDGTIIDIPERIMILVKIKAQMKNGKLGRKILHYIAPKFQV